MAILSILEPKSIFLHKFNLLTNPLDGFVKKMSPSSSFWLRRSVRRLFLFGHDKKATPFRTKTSITNLLETLYFVFHQV